LSSRVYRTTSPFMRVIMWVIPGFMLLAVISTLVREDGSYAQRLSSDWVFLAAPIAWIAFVGSRVGHTVVLRDLDATLEFRTMFRSVLIPVSELTTVRPSYMHQGHVVFKSMRGSILVPRFDALMAVLMWIRHRNATVPLTRMPTNLRNV
jgi:hypothetical protein